MPGAADADGGAAASRSDAAPGGLELLVPLAVLLVLIGYLPGLAAPSVSTPSLLVWTVAGPGLVALALLVARRDRAAWLLAGFLGWAALATAAADRPWQSFDSGIASSGGLVFLVAYGAWWALGRLLPERTGRQVEVALVAGLALNVLVAVVQVVSPQDSGLLSLEYDRAVGFFTNPVYFGGALAGGLALVVVRTVRTDDPRWWWGLALVVLFAAGIQLSGSRVGLLAGVGLALAALVADRVPWRRAGLVVAAVALGLLLASGATAQVGSARLTGGDASGGLGPRTTMWSAGWDSVVDHPVLGVGPGRFRAVSAPAVTADFARSEGPDVVYFDAHDLAVETAVTTGVPGLLLLVGFGVAAARRARGPLAWFAAGVALTWLLEPTAVMTAPLALLALGIAHRDPAAPPVPAVPTVTADAGSAVEVADSGGGAAVEVPSGRTRPWGTPAVVAAVVLALVGAGAGARVVLADRSFEQSRSSYDLADADRAASLVPHDPTVAAAVVQLLLTQANADPTAAHQRAALDAARDAVDLDPTNPVAWTQLANITALYGGPDRATRFERAYPLALEALRRNPWSLSALVTAHDLAVQTGDNAGAARWAARLCALDACPADG